MTDEDPGAEKPETEAAAHDGEPKDSNVRSLPGRAGTPLAERTDGEENEQEKEEEDGQQVFMVDEVGRVIRFSQLVKANTPVEVRYTMTGRSLGAGKAGLMDPYAASALMLADCVVDAVKTQYIRDENHKIEGVIQYVTLKPRVVLPALSEAAEVTLNEAKKAKAAA